MEEAMNYKGFSGYQSMLIQMNTDLKSIGDVCSELKLDEAEKAIENTAEHLRRNIFSVGVVGEFKRGKSTFINALLGQDILPANIRPCSASLNRVTYDMTPHAEILFKEGTIKEVPVDEIKTYVTKLTEESEQISSTVKEAKLYHPCQYCRNGVEIIDTPGLNDDDTMTAVTLSVIPQLDASIMVVSPLAPFSQYEEEFLRTKLLTSDLGRVMFVVNMIDLVDEDDREDIIEHIRSRISNNILNKMEDLYGKDSNEYIECKKKVGEIKLYPVASKKALKGKMKGNQEDVKESGFLELEAALENFLTEDRGAVVLQVPVSRLKNTISEIINAVQLRSSALSMSRQEFEEKNRETTEKIEELRQKKREELKIITMNSHKAFYDIRPELDVFWDKIKAGMLEYVEGISITPEELEQDKIAETQKRIMQAVENRYKLLVQQQFETIQNKINDMIGEEMFRLNKYEAEISSTMKEITISFKNNDDGNFSSIAGGVALDIAIVLTSNTLFGLGGIVTGFKEHGVKGALTGGAAGLGAGIAAELLIGALAIPISWPVIIGIGLLSSFAGRGAVRALFGRSEKNSSGVSVNNFRSALKNNVVKMVDDMRNSEDLETSVREQIDTGFTAVKNKVEEETEKLLKDTEKTLLDIKESFVKASFEREQVEQRIQQLIEVTNKIAERIYAVDKQINAVLLK